jgi:hypothetical protein
MNKKALYTHIRKIGIFCVIIVFFVLPFFVFAQAPEGIVPSCSGEECGFNDLLLLVKNVINFIIKIAMPIAAVLFAYAGYLYITDQGSGKNISKAKGIFANVGIGFAIILGAWLIVYTIVSTLLKDTTFLKPFFDI